MQGAQDLNWGMATEALTKVDCVGGMRIKELGLVEFTITLKRISQEVQPENLQMLETLEAPPGGGEDPEKGKKEEFVGGYGGVKDLSAWTK